MGGSIGGTQIEKTENIIKMGSLTFATFSNCTPTAGIE